MEIDDYMVKVSELLAAHQLAIDTQRLDRNELVRAIDHMNTAFGTLANAVQHHIRSTAKMNVLLIDEIEKLKRG